MWKNCECKLKLILTHWWEHQESEGKCVISFTLLLFFFFAAKQRSIHVPFVLSVICPLTVWFSHRCWKAREQTPAASPAFSHTPINLCIDSHLHFYTVWAELKTGWLISRCPLFSSCAGGTQWDWCPSEHLCTAQELDVLGSVCRARQLSVLFTTVRELCSCLTHILLL